jgi:hypothetical protein
MTDEILSQEEILDIERLLAIRRLKLAENGFNYYVDPTFVKPPPKVRRWDTDEYRRYKSAYMRKRRAENPNYGK